MNPNKIHQLIRSVAVYSVMPAITFAQNSGALENPLKFGTITEFVKALLGAIMYLGLPVIALVVIMAGLQFITSQGNAGKIEEAKKNLMYVVIGMGIFLGAWALTGIIANTISLFRSGL
jgi:Type IV secretion system pilin